MKKNLINLIVCSFAFFTLSAMSTSTRRQARSIFKIINGAALRKNFYRNLSLLNFYTTQKSYNFNSYKLKKLLPASLLLGYFASNFLSRRKISSQDKDDTNQSTVDILFERASKEEEREQKRFEDQQNKNKKLVKIVRHINIFTITHIEVDAILSLVNKYNVKLFKESLEDLIHLKYSQADTYKDCKPHLFVFLENLKIKIKNIASQNRELRNDFELLISDIEEMKHRINENHCIYGKIYLDAP